MVSSFTRFLDHTQWQATVSKTPLDEWSARRKDLYLTTHNTHNRQTSMPPVGFELTISTGERPQTYALDRAATGTGYIHICIQKIKNLQSYFIISHRIFRDFSYGKLWNPLVLSKYLIYLQRNSSWIGWTVPWLWVCFPLYWNKNRVLWREFICICSPEMKENPRRAWQYLFRANKQYNILNVTQYCHKLCRKQFGKYNHRIIIKTFSNAFKFQWN